MVFYITCITYPLPMRIGLSLRQLSISVVATLLGALFLIPTSPIANATLSFGDRITSFSLPDQSGGSSVHFSHDGLTAYVINGGSIASGAPSTISLINTTTDTVTKTFSYPGISPDLGFELTNDEHYFYFSDNGENNTQGGLPVTNVYKANTGSGVIVDTITLAAGANPDQLILTDSGRFLWVLESGLGAIAKIDTGNNQVIDTITLPETSNSMTLGTDKKYLFVVSRYSGTVFKIRLSDGSIVSTTTTSANCNAFQTCGAVSVNGNLWFSGASGILIVDESSNTLISTIAAGGSYTVSPCGSYIAASYDGSKVFVTDMFGEQIQVFDTASRTYLRDIDVSNLGGYPLYNVAVSPDGSTIWSTFGSAASIVSINFVGSAQPVLNTWDFSTSDSSPAPSRQISSVPDPLQRSVITSISPQTFSSDTATQITVFGSFNEQVRNISINGLMLPQGGWRQTPTSISFVAPQTSAKKILILIFNGAVPVLQLPTLLPATSTTNPTSIPIKQKVSYIFCFKPGHGTRLYHGQNPSCPDGSVKK